MSKFEMFPKGHVICNEKEQGNEVYVVLYGKLEVNKQFQDESYFNNASFVTPPSTSLKNNKSKKMNKEVGNNDVKKSWSFKGMLSRKKSSNSNAHARDTPNSYYLGGGLSISLFSIPIYLFVFYFIFYLRAILFSLLPLLSSGFRLFDLYTTSLLYI